MDAAAAAAYLASQRAARRLIAPLPADLAPRDEADGVEVQHALAVLAGAGEPVGFKIGATARRMQDYLGIHAPLGGFIAPDGIHPNGATVRFADFLNPGVECELAVRLAADLPHGPCTPAQAAAAVGALVCGIEIVENRYEDIQGVGVPTILGDRMFHAAAVLGEQSDLDWRGLDLVGLLGAITVNGVSRGDGVGGDLMGHPLNSLCWLAASPLARRFGGLKAGQAVMLGSVTPPIWLDGPCTVQVAFPPLPPVALQLV